MAGEIGHAYIAILPSMEGFDSQLSRGITPGVTSSGKDSGKKFGHEFTKASIGPLRTFGLIAGGIFAVDKISGFLKSTVALGRTQEKLSAGIGQVIKTTGGAAGVTAGEVEKLSEKISDNTGVSDLNIEAGAKMLLTFTNIRNEVGKGNDIYDRANTAVSNLAAGMNINLTSASRAVGRALNDPVKGLALLTRYGITFTTGQTKMITKLVASGKTLDAQKFILEQLQTRFGGAARKATTMGQKVEVAAENIKKRIGTALLPAIDSIEKRFLKILPGISSDVGKIRKAITDKIIPDVKSVYKKAKTFGESVITQIQTAVKTGDWSTLGQSLATGLGVAIAAAFNTSSGLLKSLGNTLGKVDWGTLGLEVGKTSVKFVAGFLIGFLANLQEIVPVIKDHWWQAIIAALSVIPLGRILGPLADVFDHIPILRAFTPLLNGVEKLGGLMEKAFGATIGRAFKAMAGAFLDGMRDEGPGIGNSVAKFAQGIVSRLKYYVENFVRAGVDLVKGLGDGILQRVGYLGGETGKIESTVLRAVKGAGTWLFKVGADVMDGLISGVKSKFGDVLSTVHGFVSKLEFWKHSPSLHDMAPTLLSDIGVKIMDSLSTGLKSGSKSVTATLHDLTNGLPKQLQASWTPVLSAIGNNFDRLKTKISATRSAANSLSSGISSGLISDASLGNAGSATARGGNAFLRQEAIGIKTFEKNLALMRKRGFSDAVVNDIDQLGLDVGGPLAANYAHATASQVRTADALERSIHRASRAIGAQAAASTYNSQMAAELTELRGIRSDVRHIGKDIVDAEHQLTRANRTKKRTKTGRAS